ncbi:hypothetical protein J437_LFUL004919 [Ladona fulva]|uniref:Uncharacterized protein n=1 Tax=Ladona fulva TaxID=123851 RepID=A0A8K0KBR3_LADFU|nr:hypothetical protein J437_LFUL004919 [Ladona fulva]
MSRDPYSGGIVSSTGSRSPRSRSRGLGGGGAGELPTVDRSPSRPYPTSYSARGSPVTRKSGGAGGGGGGGRGPHFVSRSSNSSPIDHHRHHHGYSSGGGILGGGGGGGPYSNYYYGDDVLSGSPVMMMDDRRGVGGHHRSRSASRSVSGGLGSSVPPPSSRYQSSTMDHEFVPIREPRERSLDRCGRDRSLERGGLYRDTLMMMDEDSMGGGGIGGGMYGRSARQSPNPATGGSMSGGGGILASQDPGVVPGQAAAAALRHGYIGELQHSNNDLQRELANLKKELELTNQKLGSSMHSIKTFWSPELKKERALRKEESAKYSLINDQLKLLNSENQVFNRKSLLSEWESAIRLPVVDAFIGMRMRVCRSRIMERSIQKLRQSFPS